jgi:hypothetical protein
VWRCTTSRWISKVQLPVRKLCLLNSTAKWFSCLKKPFDIAFTCSLSIWPETNPISSRERWGESPPNKYTSKGAVLVFVCIILCCVMHFIIFFCLKIN